MTARRRAALAFAGAAVLLAVASGSAGAARVEATGTVADPHFAPFEVTAQPGERIDIAATGAEPHTFTPSEGTPFAEVVVQPGQTKGTSAPTAEGDYRFYCKYHASAQAQPGQGMAGVLHVRAASAGEGPPPAKGTPLGPEIAALGLAIAGAIAGRKRKS